MFRAPNLIVLALLALGAALINGAVGYGFSSTLAPIAILWYSNRLLNPSLVSVEMVVNATLLLRDRRWLASTWPRARTLISTLWPGILLGTLGLVYLAVDDVRLVVYAALLPLVALQLHGVRRPLRDERRGGTLLAPGIGFLYALTTISGPPLALYLRNQGLSKEEFRCTIAQVRAAESTLTFATYAAFSFSFGAGFISAPSMDLLPFLLVPVAVGVPLGAALARGVTPELFGRVITVLDGLIVAYGLSQATVSLGWLTSPESYVLVASLFLGILVLARRTVRLGTPARPSADASRVAPGPPG